MHLTEVACDTDACPSCSWCRAPLVSCTVCCCLWHYTCHTNVMWSRNFLDLHSSLHFVVNVSSFSPLMHPWHLLYHAWHLLCHAWVHGDCGSIVSCFAVSCLSWFRCDTSMAGGACFRALLVIITAIDMLYRAHTCTHTNTHTRILQQVLASCSTMACCEDSGFAAKCHQTLSPSRMPSGSIWRKCPLKPACKRQDTSFPRRCMP